MPDLYRTEILMARILITMQVSCSLFIFSWASISVCFLVIWLRPSSRRLFLMLPH
jgi:hypothetical protein